MAGTELHTALAALTTTSSTASRLGADVAALRVGDSFSGAASATPGLLSGAACRELGTMVDGASQKLSGRWSEFSENLSRAVQLYAQSDDEIAGAINKVGEKFESQHTSGITAEQL